MNFTFKTEHPTGRYRSFYPDIHYIKHNKKVVGKISDKAPYVIRLIVEKTEEERKNSNCSWKWIKIKRQFASINEAKEWLKTNHDKIVSQVTLHYLD
jgi:hypothetical protein